MQQLFAESNSDIAFAVSLLQPPEAFMETVVLGKPDLWHACKWPAKLKLRDVLLC